MTTTAFVTMALMGFIYGIEAFVFAYLKKASMLGNVEKILIYALLIITWLVSIILMGCFNSSFKEICSDKTKQHIMLVREFLCFVVPMLLVTVTTSITVLK